MAPKDAYVPIGEEPAAERPTAERPTDAKDTAKGASASADAATFSLLYESRDDRLCLFETEEGHLAAVRTSRLA